jgi:hypothetical protein
MSVKQSDKFSLVIFGVFLILTVFAIVVSTGVRYQRTTYAHGGTVHSTPTANVYDAMATAHAPFVDYNATVEPLPDFSAGVNAESRAVGTPTNGQRIAALETAVAIERTRNDDQAQRIARIEAIVSGQPTPTMQPSATPVPVASATPRPTAQPTATPVSNGFVGLCRRQNLPCENGDDAPQWVRDYELSRGRSELYVGMHNTSQAEHTVKAFAMKSYLERIVYNCAQFNFSNNTCTTPATPRAIDVFIVAHGASTPIERATVAHSYRVWFREPSGVVSHVQGWYKSAGFGFPRVPNFDGTPERQNFPIIFGPSRATVAQGGARAEQWYVGCWGFDMTPCVEFGITFVNSVAYIQPNEKTTDYDVSKWDLSGDLGLTRRMEITFYRGQTRDDNARSGVFWATQFGQIVSGPNDARCNAPITISGTTYTQMCLEQQLSSTLPEISFASTRGGNAFQKTYNATGVQAPN